MTLMIIPTFSCNMCCAHCYQSFRSDDNKMLPVGSALKFIDLASRQSKDLRIIFHGGEPTLWGMARFQEYLVGLHALAQKQDVKFTMILQSNGLLLCGDFWKLLSNEKMTFSISFDGIHNSILRQQSEVVLKNIRTIRDSGARLGLLSVETTQTIDDMISNYNWFKKEHLNYKILPIYSFGRASPHKEWLLDPEVYAHEMIKLYKHWLYDLDCNIQVQTLEAFVKIHIIKNHRLRVGGNCVGNCYTLMPDGYIWLCNRPFPEEYRFANVSDISDFKQLNETKGFQKVLELQNSNHLKCRYCQHYEICHSGCLANTFLKDNGIDGLGSSCLKTRSLLTELKVVNEELVTTYLKAPSSINPRARSILEKMLMR